MFHLGALERPLVYGHFEAWEYGPVHPELYHFLKLFGSRPVPENFEVFTYVDDIHDGTEVEWLDDAASAFPPGNGPRLVAMTHRKDGAWLRYYDPLQRGVEIPSESIVAEYRLFQNGG